MDEMDGSLSKISTKLADEGWKGLKELIIRAVRGHMIELPHYDVNWGLLYM